MREHLLLEPAHIADAQIVSAHIINPFTPDQWQQIMASITYRLGTLRHERSTPDASTPTAQPDAHE